MNIKIIAFSSEIEELRNNQLFDAQIAGKFPGALWAFFFKNRCPFNLECQTVDKTLKLIRENKLDPSTVLVFQHGLDKESIELINLGAHPFLLNMYESPLYCSSFYDKVSDYLDIFHYVKIFGGKKFKNKKLSQAYFPCFSISKLESHQPTKDWDKRRFAIAVMGNKYVLTRPLFSFTYWQDWVWWFAKSIRQYISGPRLPNKIHINEIQLQDKRYEILMEMLQKGLIDLYGNGWNRLIRIPPSLAKKLSPFLSKNKVHSIEDKAEIISGYRFNLCFENLSYPGYITEKIFDSMIAQTIPVYWGAPDISEFIPPNSFINASKFNNIKALIDHLLKIDSTEAEIIIKNGQKFLQSPKGKKFSYESVSDELINDLDKFLRANV
jgi:hypothetical protein